jgi:hypothetical protein
MILPSLPKHLPWKLLEALRRGKGFQELLREMLGKA